jgi:hypothetical protein
MDRVTAQVASFRLSTAKAGVQAQVTSCGICVEQSDIGAGFLQVLRLSLPFSSTKCSKLINHLIIDGTRSRYWQHKIIT